MTTSPITLGSPIVLFIHTQSCDRCGADVTLYTDGYQAYATCGNADSIAVDRDPDYPGTVVVRCGLWNNRQDQICGGGIMFNLAYTAGAWYPSTPSVAPLLALGVPIGDNA